MTYLTSINRLKLLQFLHEICIVKLLYFYKNKFNKMSDMQDISPHLIHKAIVYSASDKKISELRDTSFSWDIYPTSQAVYDRCQNNSIFYASQTDPEYHFKLSLVYSSPYIIYRKGNIDLLHRNILTIVGPRNYSSYGEQVMESLFSILPSYDLVTISWLAPGIDMMAHQMSIKAGIPTIAVLWAWLGWFMKSRHRDMIQSIIDHGWLVLSEFKLAQWPERYTFPQRNRIVAGVSDAIFLPEAGLKSGSLITVDFARQMHKPVYGAPSNIYSLSSQWLLQYMQQWLVQPVVKFEEMLDKYFGKKLSEWHSGRMISQESLSHLEVSQVAIILQKNPTWLTLEALVSQAGLSIEEVMSQLTMAEVMGQVRNDGGVWRIR